MDIRDEFIILKLTLLFCSDIMKNIHWHIHLIYWLVYPYTHLDCPLVYNRTPQSEHLLENGCTAKCLFDFPMKPVFN